MKNLNFTKALTLGLFIAIFNILPNISFAAGAVKLSDYETEGDALKALGLPTITGLGINVSDYVDDSADDPSNEEATSEAETTEEIPIYSAYELNLIDDISGYSDFYITKYVIGEFSNNDVSYTPYYYSVDIKDTTYSSSTYSADVAYSWTSGVLSTKVSVSINSKSYGVYKDDKSNTAGSTTFYWDSDGALTTESTYYKDNDMYHQNPQYNTEAFTVSYDSSTDERVKTGELESNYVGIENKNLGAAIYLSGASSSSFYYTSAIKGNFINNSTTDCGGAIYAYNYEIDTITGDFIGNSATDGSGGAIYAYNYEIDTITGDFIGNSADDYGGAIYSDGEIGTIVGDFILNTADTEGGAIYSMGKIGTITGDFIGNSASYRGGAIYANQGEIDTITGDFIGNSADTEGGAIYANQGEIGTITGDFIGNSATTRSGGAIYNDGDIDIIIGDFIDNTATTESGAIYNAGEITTITGDFIGNSANTEGGAIYNYSYSYSTYSSSIDTITGDFIDNSADSGGAIYNYSYSTYSSSIGTITGDFIDNTADTEGGAIYNSGDIGTITGDFIDNTADTEGGAIYNAGDIDTIIGDFIDNSSKYYGGAIYNTGDIDTITGDFIGNSANDYGGAIYVDGSSSIITLVAGLGDDYYYLGNHVSFSSYYGGFLYIKTGTVEFATALGASITIGYLASDANYIADYDSIASKSENGDDTYIKKTGEGDLIVNSSMEYYYGSLDIEAGTMYYTNSEGLSSSIDITIGKSTEITTPTTPTANFETDADVLSGTITINVDGALTLTGGELVDSTIVNNGIISIAGLVTVSVAVDGYLGFDLTDKSNTLFLTDNGSNLENVDGVSIYMTKLSDIDNDLLSSTALILNANNTSVYFYEDVLLGSAYYDLGEQGTVEFYDTAYLFTTTLSELYYTPESGVDIKSAYYLADANDNTSFAFTKYYVDSDGDLTPVKLALNIADRDYGGNEEILYYWDDNGSLSKDASGDLAFTITYDSTITYNEKINEGTELLISGDFVGIEGQNGYGGAIYNYASSGDAIIDEIIGNFIGNSDIYNGGAISNTAVLQSDNAIIYEITGDFIGNYLSGGSYANGGAIYNQGEIKSIVGNFIANYASASSEALGGAIYNYGDIDTITGDFIGNSLTATAAASSASGGAIYNAAASSATINKITGDFIGNSVTTTGNYDYSHSPAYASAYGGAIYNSYSETGIATIATITGDFIGNSAIGTGTYAYAIGGAIYNTATIGTITGDFIGNSATSSYLAYGGAIYNSGTITSITSDFIGNSVKGSDFATGGAIYNTATIGDTTDSDLVAIKGDFIGNSATSSDSTTGGAIYNSGTITSITGDFTDNSAKGTSASGGAIYNAYASSGTVTISSIIGSFRSNYASASASARGGAIYNGDDITLENATFTGNYASASTYAYGGAIYNAGTITLSANENNIYYYTGNWAGVDEDSRLDENGGFLYMYSGTAKFDTASDAHIVIGDENKTDYDSITSKDNTSTIIKTGEGTLTVNSSMEYYYGDLEIDEGIMSYLNSAVLGSTDITIGNDDNDMADFYVNADSFSSSTEIVVNANSTLSLVGGTLDVDSITGAGFTEIAGDVTVNSSIATALLMIDGTGTLTTDADNLDSIEVVIGNSSTLILTGGTLDVNELRGEGTTEIDGDVTVNASIKKINLSILTDSNLSIDADNLDTTVDIVLKEDGILSLTDGTLSVGSLSNDGVIAIDGDVTINMSIDGALCFDLNANRSVSLSAINGYDLSAVTDVLLYIDLLNATEYSNLIDESLAATLAADVDVAVIYYGGLVLDETVENSNGEFLDVYTLEDGDLTINSIASVFTTTLSDLYYSETSGVLTDSAYYLTGRNGAVDPFSINKYYVDSTSGEIGSVSLMVNIDDKDYTTDSSSNNDETINYLWNASWGMFTTDDTQLSGISLKLFEVTYDTASTSVAKGDYDSNTKTYTGDFSKQSSSSSGGAIDNGYDNISSIVGNFSNNTSDTSLSDNYGGAIYNHNIDSIDSIAGNFITNSAVSGGAIANTLSSNITNITGNFIDNTAVAYVDTTDNNKILGGQGGAIYNTASTIGTITGDFIANEAKLQGGAIYSAGGTSKIDTIIGDFIGNISGSNGGAIANALSSSINNIIGSFIANAGIYGGAINNHTATIGNITGDFIGNYASYTGGSIYNGTIADTTDEAIIGSITGDFIFNSSGSIGGAILNINNATINSITGDFVSNKATSGGAIANSNATLSSISGNFTDNSATTYGGAIYSTGKDSLITLSADAGEDYYYIGNYVASKDASNTDASGGFLYIDSGEIVFDIEKGASITIGDGTLGYDSIASNSENSFYTTIDFKTHGTLSVNSSMENYYGSLAISDGTFITTADNFVNMSDVENYGTIGLLSGTLTNTIKGTGDIYIDGYVISDADNFYNTGYLETTSGSTLKLIDEGDLQVFGIINDGTIIIAGHIVTYNSIAGSLAFDFVDTTADVKLDSSGVDNIDSITDLSIYMGAMADVSNMIDSYLSFASVIAKNEVYVYFYEDVLLSHTLKDGTENYTLSDNGTLVFHDSAYVFTTTLSELYYTANSGITIKSGYSLLEADVDDSFVIKKYYKDSSETATSMYEGVNLRVEVSSELGDLDGDTTIYYKWATSSANADSLVLTDVTADVLNSTETYDFYYTYDSANTSLRLSNPSGDVEADFVDNSTSSDGAAIYNNKNSDKIDTITGDFANNSAIASVIVSGGAIYNYYSKIGTITGDFIYNSASVSSSTSASASGGAIYNYYGSIIDSIRGSFVGNYAFAGSSTVDSSDASLASGGAISNDYSRIGTVTGDFIGNYAVAAVSNIASQSSASALGGAIYNNSSYSATINTITGDFIGNYVSASSEAPSYALGGAIYNNATDSTINAITGDFLGNYAVASGYLSSYALGGAIYNSATGTSIINAITSDFTGNYVSSSLTTSLTSESTISYSLGGAIYNYANTSANLTINSITGDFIDNYAEGITALGGAIYNYSNDSYLTIESITGNFIDNYAEGTTALGGAIYNEGLNSTITLSADAGNAYYYEGNWAGASETSRSDESGGFLYMENGTVAFDTATDGSITIGYDETDTNYEADYDSIASSETTADDTTIIKTGEGILTVNSSMEYYYGDLYVDAGLMYYNNTLGLGSSYITVGDTSDTYTAKLITSASNFATTAEITVYSDGTLSLTGGTLDVTSLSGEGTTEIDGVVIAESSIDTEYLTISSTAGASLTISADDLTSREVTNEGILVLSEGFTDAVITGGSLSILKDVEISSYLSATDLTIAQDATLSINAEDLDARISITNAGIISLIGGDAGTPSELDVVITSGTLNIAGIVSSNVEISTTLTINEDASLSMDIEKLTSSSITTDGALILSGGTTAVDTLVITSGTAGTGSLEISGTTTGNLTVNANGDVGLASVDVDAVTGTTSITGDDDTIVTLGDDKTVSAKVTVNTADTATLTNIGEAILTDVSEVIVDKADSVDIDDVGTVELTSVADVDINTATSVDLTEVATSTTLTKLSIENVGTNGSYTGEITVAEGGLSVTDDITIKNAGDIIDTKANAGDLTSTDGSITLENIASVGNLRATTSGEEISLANVGTVASVNADELYISDVDNVTGDISATNSTGIVVNDTVGGYVNITSATGTVSIATVKGTLTLGSETTTITGDLSVNVGQVVKDTTIYGTDGTTTIVIGDSNNLSGAVEISNADSVALTNVSSTEIYTATSVYMSDAGTQSSIILNDVDTVYVGAGLISSGSLSLSGDASNFANIYTNDTDVIAGNVKGTSVDLAYVSKVGTVTATSGAVEITNAGTVGAVIANAETAQNVTLTGITTSVASVNASGEVIVSGEYTQNIATVGAISGSSVDLDDLKLVGAVTSTGDVNINNVGTVASVSAGSLLLTDVDNVTSDIIASSSTGIVVNDTVGGYVNINSVTGTLSIDTVEGNVNVASATGTLSIDTVKGVLNLGTSDSYVLGEVSVNVGQVEGDSTIYGTAGSTSITIGNTSTESGAVEITNASVVSLTNVASITVDNATSLSITNSTGDVNVGDVAKVYVGAGLSSTGIVEITGNATTLTNIYTDNTNTTAGNISGTSVDLENIGTVGNVTATTGTIEITNATKVGTVTLDSASFASDATSIDIDKVGSVGAVSATSGSATLTNITSSVSSAYASGAVTLSGLSGANEVVVGTVEGSSVELDDLASVGKVTSLGNVDINNVSTVESVFADGSLVLAGVDNVTDYINAASSTGIVVNDKVGGYVNIDSVTGAISIKTVGGALNLGTDNTSDVVGAVSVNIGQVEGDSTIYGTAGSDGSSITIGDSDNKSGEVKITNAGAVTLTNTDELTLTSVYSTEVNTATSVDMSNAGTQSFVSLSNVEKVYVDEEGLSSSGSIVINGDTDSDGSTTNIYSTSTTAGDVEGASVDLDNIGEVGNVTATTGTVEITSATKVGDVTVDSTSFASDKTSIDIDNVDSVGAVSAKSGSVEIDDVGTLEYVIANEADTVSNITLISVETITGTSGDNSIAVSASGDIIINNSALTESSISGDLIADGNITLTDVGTITGDISSDGYVSISGDDTVVTGTITSGYLVDLDVGEVGGDFIVSEDVINNIDISEKLYDSILVYGNVLNSEKETYAIYVKEITSSDLAGSIYVGKNVGTTENNGDIKILTADGGSLTVGGTVYGNVTIGTYNDAGIDLVDLGVVKGTSTISGDSDTKVTIGTLDEEELDNTSGDVKVDTAASVALTNVGEVELTSVASVEIDTATKVDLSNLDSTTYLSVENIGTLQDASYTGEITVAEGGLSVGGNIIITNAGAIIDSDSAGDLTSTTGSITLENVASVGNLRATTSGEEISLTNVGTVASVNAAELYVSDVDNVTYGISATSSTGVVVNDTVGGTVDIDSVTGAISIKTVGGALNLGTDNTTDIVGAFSVNVGQVEGDSTIYGTAGSTSITIGNTSTESGAVEITNAGVVSLTNVASITVDNATSLSITNSTGDVNVGDVAKVYVGAGLSSTGIVEITGNATTLTNIYTDNTDTTAGNVKGASIDLDNIGTVGNVTATSGEVEITGVSSISGSVSGVGSVSITGLGDGTSNSTTVEDVSVTGDDASLTLKNILSAKDLDSTGTIDLINVDTVKNITAYGELTITGIDTTVTGLIDAASVVKFDVVSLEKGEFEGEDVRDYIKIDNIDEDSSVDISGTIYNDSSDSDSNNNGVALELSLLDGGSIYVGKNVGTANAGNGDIKITTIDDGLLEVGGSVYGDIYIRNANGGSLTVGGTITGDFNIATYTDTETNITTGIDSINLGVVKGTSTISGDSDTKVTIGTLDEEELDNTSGDVKVDTAASVALTNVGEIELTKVASVEIDTATKVDLTNVASTSTELSNLTIKNIGSIQLDGSYNGNITVALTGLTVTNDIKIENAGAIFDTNSDAGDLISTDGSITLTNIASVGDLKADAVTAQSITLDNVDTVASVSASGTADISSTEVTGTINADTLYLTDSSALSTIDATSVYLEGSVYFGGLVSSDSLSLIDQDTVLTTNADYLAKAGTITNDGTINLTDGTLSNAIADSAGTTNSQLNISSTENNTTTIAASVIADGINITTGSVSIDNDSTSTFGKLNAGEGSITVESSASLTTNAENLIAADISLEDKASLDLTDGDLSIAVVGKGDVTISGEVAILDDGTSSTGSITADTISISKDASLETDADNLTADSISSEGKIILTGGKLSVDINYNDDGTFANDGTVVVDGYVSAIDAHIGADVLEISDSGELTIVEKSLSVYLIENDGVLNLLSDSGYDDDSSSVDITNTGTMLVDVSSWTGENDITNEGDITIQGSGTLYTTVYKSDESTTGDTVMISSYTNDENEYVSSSVTLGEDAYIEATSFTVDAGNSLISTADQLAIDSMTNEGEITLNGGTLISKVNTETKVAGTINITEDVVAQENVYLVNLNLAENSSYTADVIYANYYTLGDGAVIDVDVLSNCDVDSTTYGITMTVNADESATVIGDIKSNSPHEVNGGGTLTVDGSLYTTGTGDDYTQAGSSYGDVTISDSTTLKILGGSITTGYTNALAVSEAGESWAYAKYDSEDTAQDVSGVNINEGSTLEFVDAGTDYSSSKILAGSAVALFNDVGIITNDGTIDLTYTSDLDLYTLVYVADEITSGSNDGISNLYSELDLSLDDFVIYNIGTEDLVLAYLPSSAFEAENKNEEELAQGLNDLDTSTGNYENDLENSNLKIAIANDGLGSYIFNSYSYIAEVESMLLSNMNFANVNRAREILARHTTEKSKLENPKVEATQENYTKLAQLQSINLLGSKNQSSGVAGYDYWSVGSTANIDFFSTENAVFGASLGGAYNKVEGEDNDNANSEAFLLNTYFVYSPQGYSFDVFANLGYAHFWNEGNKLALNAKWQSDAINALVGVEYNIETIIDGLTIHPLAMLNLVFLNTGDADVLGNSTDMHIDSQNYFSAKLMLGLEAKYAITEQFNASVRAMYAYELGDESYDFTYDFGSLLSGVNYIGGEAGRSSAIMGIGLSYDFTESFSGYFDYNVYIYESLMTHSLNLSLGLKF